MFLVRYGCVASSGWTAGLVWLLVSASLSWVKWRSSFVVGFAHWPRGWTGLSIWLSGAWPYRYSDRSTVAVGVGRDWPWHIYLQDTTVNLDMAIGAGSVLVRS